MVEAYLVLTLALVFGLYMAWGIGANDVANAMATSVGSRALTVGQAIMIAAVFEFLGAFLAGGEVTSTVRKDILDVSSLASEPDVLICGMLASLLAAGTWLMVASHYGWPVSTTHSIIGAIIGFGIVAVGADAVYWGEVGSIAASWVVSPLLAGGLAFFMFRSMQRLIFEQDDPLARAKRYGPFYAFLTALVIALVTFLKGLKHVGLDISPTLAIVYSLLFALGIMSVAYVVISRLQFSDVEDSRFREVERIFGVLMVVTAAAMAFAHGSNDVANAIGPVAAIVSVVSTGEVMQETALPPWVLLLGGGGIVLGLATYGYRVIATVGTRITELTPSRGFAAGLSAATIVVLASGTGLPISTTHTLVGAVLGIGLARGIGALDLGVIRSIFTSWIVTLPVGAVLAVVFYYILSAVLF
ncbi:MAG: inorganic phosphate transporter [Gammaproteobacteria bacterium]|nr:inorganic phosphate transporter [Gammaproteobacteria bacterium]